MVTWRCPVCEKSLVFGGVRRRDGTSARASGRQAFQCTSCRSAIRNQFGFFEWFLFAGLCLIPFAMLLDMTLRVSGLLVLSEATLAVLFRYVWWIAGAMVIAYLVSLFIRSGNFFVCDDLAP